MVLAALSKSGQICHLTVCGVWDLCRLRWHEGSQLCPLDGSEGKMEGQILRGGRGQLKWLTWRS